MNFKGVRKVSAGVPSDDGGSGSHILVAGCSQFSVSCTAKLELSLGFSRIGVGCVHKNGGFFSNLFYIVDWLSGGAR